MSKATKTAVPATAESTTPISAPILNTEAPITTLNAGVKRQHRAPLHFVGARRPVSERIAPETAYTRVTGWTRVDFEARLKLKTWHKGYPTPEEREKHEEGEAAYRTAERRSPEYYFDKACAYAGAHYVDEKMKAEAATQLMESLATRAIAMGKECSLITPSNQICEDYFSSLDEMFSLLSVVTRGPVVMTRKSAPVLMQFLRVCLTLSDSQHKMRQFHPFAWEHWGDDNAADWSKPQTMEDFATLFAEMLEDEDYTDTKAQWMASGLTLEDVMAVDRPEEPEEFSLTIVGDDAPEDDE